MPISICATTFDCEDRYFALISPYPSEVFPRYEVFFARLKTICGTASFFLCEQLVNLNSVTHKWGKDLPSFPCSRIGSVVSSVPNVTMTNPNAKISTLRAGCIASSLNLITLIGIACSCGAADSQLSDSNSLCLPAVGAYQLRIITPTILELTLITTKQPDPA